MAKQKAAEKDIFKTLAVVLAVLIAAVVIGGAVLMMVLGGGKSASGETAVEKTELKATAPTEKEMKMLNRVTISADKGITAETEKEKEEETDDKTAEDYILPESNSKILTDADIEGLSLKELNYAKNEIYARHGRKFQSQELNDYFGSKSWYEGKYEGTDFDNNYSAKLLSDTEKKNAEFLKKAENAMSSGGYQLDKN